LPVLGAGVLAQVSAEASVQLGEFRLGPFLCLAGFVALLVALLQLPA